MDAAQAEMIAEAQRADNVRVIVVNDTWRLIPSADVLFASDYAWWFYHQAAVRSGFLGELWTSDERAGNVLGINRIAIVRKYGGLSNTPGQIVNGGNSGHHAVGIAHAFGARRILLVGYDMQKAADGRRHWFGEHASTENGRRTGLAQAFPVAAWLKHFAVLATDLQRAGVECVNCSKETAMTCIARGDLRQNLWRD